MANTSRSISQACGKASDKSRWDPSGCIVIGQHVELASKKKEEKANTLSWLVKKIMIGQHVELASKKNEW